LIFRDIGLPPLCIRDLRFFQGFYTVWIGGSLPTFRGKRFDFEAKNYFPDF